MLTRRELRARMREQRRQLTAAQRAQAARALAAQVARLPAFLSAYRISTYLAFDGELDPNPLIDIARSQEREIYLPLLKTEPEAALHFARWDLDSPLRKNRFGIAEPAAPHVSLSPRELDLVLTPLVAFDVQGNRIGMGGGYYDRTFAFLRQQPIARKPILLGLAYELQKQAHIIPQDWDVPLWGVATERATYTTN